MNALARISAALLLLSLVGCAHTVMVLAPAQLPARVPVQVFPSVWIAGPADGDEGYILDRLAAHLARDPRREVRRVELEQLEPARLAGQIPSLTAVVRIKLKLAHDRQLQNEVVPIQYCGMFGCSTQFQTYTQMVDISTAEAQLIVHDGPSAHVLQQALFKVSANDMEDERPDALAIERLADQLVAGSDVMRIREPYTLYNSDIDNVQRGVQLLLRSQWQDGRAALEQAARELGGHKKETQARVWYDLGVARLLAPGAAGLDQSALDAAARAFAWAVRLAPTREHQQAVDHVAELRIRQRRLAEQDAAQKQNFSRAARGD